MVVGLGLLAIWASEIVPAWFDPLMERVVGVTLLVLGGWVFYSLWRFGTTFRLQSRWMLLFGLAGRGWRSLYAKITGRTLAAHDAAHEFMQYGPLAAIGIGVLHGFGAETGSQALLLGTAAGVTSRQAGSVLLLSFVVGLLVANSLVAAFSVAGFVSTRMRRTVYTGLGVVVAAFSLFVGAFFVTGHGDALPDLQKALQRVAAVRIPGAG
jgi:high-affinity nickel-transport protein